VDRKPPLYAELPVAELLKQLSTDLTTLVRGEVTLARLEIAEKSKGAGPAIGLFAVAALFGAGAFVALTIGIIGAFATFLPLWAAGLIVTAIYVAFAALAALRGKAGLAAVKPPIPDRAIASIKADVDAIRSGLQRER
jgi:uncharacterized membrane protein YqjE